MPKQDFECASCDSMLGPCYCNIEEPTCDKCKMGFSKCNCKRELSSKESQRIKSRLCAFCRDPATRINETHDECDAAVYTCEDCATNVCSQPFSFSCEGCWGENSLR